MASNTSSQVQQLDLNGLIKKWLSTYQKGNFINVLKEHWRDFVLVAFSNSEVGVEEERCAEELLFRPMEHFLCNGDPEAVFKALKEKDQPSQLCGHVFKNGEPTYSCRECATDPTCVLCMDCFQTSVHKTHRYRMHTSGGGGYCDCGDPEAWKTGVFCGAHQPKEEVMDDSKELVEELPADLTDRASALFMATLRYAVEVLTWEGSDSLPDGLKPEGELNDSYLCMLFNDEIHTFEQVINTLQKATSCTQQEAVDIATTIDREGKKTVVKGTFSDCEKVRNVIERHTSRHGARALKVQVMHTAVVSHQQFALRMISWLQSIIVKSDGLRRLFCLLSMQQQENEKSLMEVLLLADTRLWKSARIQSHQLMMAGVLMDQDCKKRFAILFTKHYPSLMKAFCLDDHDHDVSIASLSVQIFTVISLWYNDLMRDFIQDDHSRTVSVTSISVQIFSVPTLARVLVAEHNLLTVILKTFLQVCEEKKNKDGKLSFERTGTQTFKRACFSLHDLKYALICKPAPAEWTDELRKGFLEGFGYFLELLKLIEGMDEVRRQTGQHLQFEPEWEGAFNLQLKLEDNIALAMEWCGSDRQVLQDSYNKAVEVFIDNKIIDRSKKEILAVGHHHTVKCLKYDVSSQPISVHIPLTRILGGLHTYLAAQNLSFTSPDCCLSMPDPVELIELPLRVQVLVAQCQANMWRRNGYALINQIFFYHNVKCRTEMYDRDIVLLQIGASMMDPSNFLVHLINRYGLKAWAKEEYDVPSGQEDSLRQTVMLAEEFLEQLVIILSERYIIGVGNVTKSDIVKREVIHQLCISSMAHSELAKGLPEDPNHETGLEEVVKDVAVFKKAKSSKAGKGMYELKPEFYSIYNPYFYHYSKTEKSKSEETQVKRKKEGSESQALPPPVPPRFTAQLAPVTNLLQCDVMIYLMELILTRTSATRSRSWSETQLERILHLIGLALHEQKVAIEEGNTQFDFLAKACASPTRDPKTKKESRNIQTLLEAAVGCQNITHDSLKDLVGWTIKKLTEVRQMKNEPVAMETTEQVPAALDEKAEAERRKKAAAAAQRRKKIMAQMSTMQKNFIKENAELFENTSTDLIPRVGSEMDLGDSEVDSAFPVAVGPHKRNMTGQIAAPRGSCILCQEEQEIMLNNKAMVLTAFVQKSTVLSKCHGNALLNGEEHDPLLMGADMTTGSHTGSCGHMMHADCWQRFYDAILVRERRRPLRFRHNYSYDIEKKEFLCPLCECISNTVIPVLPSLSTLAPSSGARRAESNLQFRDWLDGIHKTVINSIKEADEMDASEDVLYQPCSIALITKQMAEGVANNFQTLWACVQEQTPPTSTLCKDLKEMLKKFSIDTYSFGLGVDPDDDNPRVPIMVWNTCAFTILSLEQILRDEGKPLFGNMSSRQSDCLKALVKVASIFSSATNVDVAKEHCIRLLSFLFPDPLKKKVDECLLDVDMFHYLTSLVMSLPSLHLDSSVAPSVFSLPSGGTNDQHAIHLVMAAHLVQVLLSFDQEAESMEVEGDYEGEALLIIYDKLHSVANIKKEITPLPWQLSLYVRKAMLPFLRCAGLLFSTITDVPPPAQLTEEISDLYVEEFDLLCRYLGVSTHMSRLIDNQGELLDTFVTRWCKNLLLKEKFSASCQPIIHYPVGVNHLIPLPDDYSELINKVSTFTCPKSDGDDSRAPTMCLVCGKMLCSQSYCCQTEFEGATMGAATEHTYKCGAGTGIFLRVRECQILLLAGKSKGCFVPPPYVDDYGETDQGLRRGNPLHLCKESYAHLQKLWMTQAIPETIAHNLESNSQFITIDWQHL